MLKREELNDPTSCLSRAASHEMTFVLLARDLCAPATIRYWCELRIQSGKNSRTDAQIVDAMRAAKVMEDQFPVRELFKS